MDSIALKDFIVYGILIVVILWVTRLYNFWGASVGSKKAKQEKTELDKQFKKTLYLRKVLKSFEVFAQTVGGEVKNSDKFSWGFRIARLNITLKNLDRQLKVIEIIGCFRLLMFVGILFIITGILLFKNILIMGFGLTLFLAPKLIAFFVDEHINNIDKEIEIDFPNLYLLIYTRLLKGAYARLSPTLDEFIKTTKKLNNGQEKAITRFAQDLRNNIEIYSDESIALNETRVKYKSAMIVNFCNLAQQSLNGVDNSDKLLAFKIELTNREIRRMEENSLKIQNKARRAIYAIFVILFQFVVISWVSKMQFDFSMIFSLFQL